MAFWNKKKNNSNNNLEYLNENNICYEIENGDNTKIKLQLCIPEKNIMIYPYITIDNGIVSVNINVNKQSLKNYDYSKLNDFNIKSKFFKAYILDNGVIVLEYRFNDETKLNSYLKLLIDSLYSLQNEIDEF